MNALPHYVVRPAEAVHLQPYDCLNTQIYGFYLKGDAATMQRRLVDPILNAPTGGATNYRVISDMVLVAYAFAARCSSILPPDNQMGWVPENSWTIWIPLVAVKTEFGIEIAQRLVFFPAYISVDNSWSVAAGREVYGFPKSYGPVVIPAASAPPLQFSASAFVMKTYTPDEQGTVAPLMVVNRTAEGTEGGAVWNDIETAVKAVAHMWSGHSGTWIVPGLNLLLDILGLIRHEEVPGVFLKQFRDAADGTRACYQAIIEAGSGVTKLHGGGLLPGTFTATVSDFASHPLAADLGLAGPDVPLEFPFWANFDFTISRGTEIWKAS